MRKYDNRVKLNWIEKIFEWVRLKREISKLRLSIWSKESRAGKSLLRYKHLGIPTLKLNLEIKEKELEVLFSKKGESRSDGFIPDVVVVEDGIIPNFSGTHYGFRKAKPRKVRSDKGKSHQKRTK